MILLEGIHNGFHNMNHKDIVAVDIVVHNTWVVKTVETAEAVEVHIEEAKVHIVVLQVHIEVVEVHIVVLQVHIVVVEVHIVVLAVVEVHIVVLAVVDVHIVVLAVVDKEDTVGTKDRNVVILERYLLLGESLGLQDIQGTEEIQEQRRQWMRGYSLSFYKYTYSHIFI